MSPARLLLPLSLALLGACAQTPRHIVLVEEPSDCPLTLYQDQTLLVTLHANPSTGFQWQVRDPAGNILRSLGPEAYQADDKELVVGGGGKLTWRYKTTQPGSGRLLMTYQRPWETDSEPATTFECAIQVR